ncbi:Transcription initiation factor TFIID subunit 8 [Auxenochlorella protothecoides]|uniref:Transcription initiation factor TFIID subunit 8 n=2 Tax=Auxenochlorella protothecoides TaxID=3075 RepID=A0A087S9Q5_AUXPR|nr:Transcription initiation factor TFIID subunit 8 [Auxenochlorella protothecoides]KFM22459.1 Transcription initiation factor TFIID subunit 8 [Auxenochlorella protothecoides]
MSDQYALAVARIVVAKLADGSGFDALQTSSASILSELLVRYMEEVGVSSHAYTELAGRTEPSAMDVLFALNDMGVSVTELKEFKQSQPKGSAFPAPIIPFPAPPAHIPDFLPAFPDRHTYCETHELPLPDADPAARHLAGMEAQQAAEQALVKLHARAAPQDPVLASALPSKEEGPAAAAEGGARAHPDPAVPELDPWSAPPLPDDVGPPTPPFPGGTPAEEGATVEDAADADMPDAKPEPLRDPEVAAALGATLAPAFQPWDWQARLLALATQAQSQAPEEDAFAATAPGAMLSTKHGRHAKRSARALEASYVPADPTRQRVEEIIAVSGLAGGPKRGWQTGTQGGWVWRAAAQNTRRSAGGPSL